MNLGTALVAVKADIKDLRKDLQQAKAETAKATEAMQSRANKTTASIKAMWLAWAAGAAIVASTAMKAIKAASDLQETTSKFNVVFKGQQELAESWAKTLTESYAMSTREAKANLASIQDLLVPMGMAANEAGKLSFEIVKLSADLGSFNNLPTAQVMLDVQSALVGNFETMKKYGVVLNATVVQQKALEMGLAATKNELTAGMKAQAAYALMMEGSQAAIGDMERTSDSYANTVKQAQAAWEDLMASLGELILPVATKVVGGLASIIKEINRLIDTMDDLMLAEDPFGMGTMGESGDVIAEALGPGGAGPGTGPPPPERDPIVDMKEVMRQAKDLRDDDTTDLYSTLLAQDEFKAEMQRRDIERIAMEQEALREFGVWKGEQRDAELRATEEALMAEMYMTEDVIQDQTAMWEEYYQRQIRNTQLWGTFFLSTLAQIRTKSLPIQLAILAIQTGIQFAMAVASAHAAANLAMATIPPPAGEIVAAARLAWGMHNAYMILAQAGGQAAGMGISAAMGGSTSISGGTAGGGGPSGIGPAAPLEGQQGQINIYIEGDMLADEYYIELLAEKISEAVEGSEVRLISSSTRET